MAEDNIDTDTTKALARALWTAEMRTTNPSASIDERKGHWRENRTAYKRLSRKVMRSMAKAGFSISRSAS